MTDRRTFLKTAAGSLGAALVWGDLHGALQSSVGTGALKIKRIETATYRGPSRSAAHLEIAADTGAVGRFGPLEWGIPNRLDGLMIPLRKLLMEKDPLDRGLEFEGLWNALYPGRPIRQYADGIDPLTGRKIWGTTRGEKRRHSDTGVTILSLSAVDNALWDLRGKLLGRPVHRLIGSANRMQIPVYTRIGEGRDLKEARTTAREFYDRGHVHQKWYFVYGPSDGQEGLHANLELVRVLREELGPEAVLMFDNHSMRFEIGGDWVVSLAKAMLPYRPFWLEEPTAPEDIEGYARIKGETGITLAAGEHHYTRWQIKPLLDRKSLDWVQSDPDWCGGISEWIRICAMARECTGVQVVPHSDNLLTDCQCVASQPESLCPMLEYNAGQTQNKMGYRTRILAADVERFVMPDEPGLGPDIDTAKCKRL